MAKHARAKTPEPVAKAEMSFDVVGTSGLRRSGGYVHEEFLNKLKGLKGVEFFKEFTDNNPQAGAIRFVIESLIRQAGWTAVKAKDATDPQEADTAHMLLETAMEDMEHGWQDMIVEMLSALRFGFSYANVPYKIRRGPDGPPQTRSEHDDGFIAWRAIDFRSQDSLERWEFDEQGKLLGMWQMDGWTGKRAFIPIDQAVHFRIDKFKDNPEGRSMYRNAAVSYLRLKALDDIEAVGAEREMTGVPVMEVPPQILNPRGSAQDGELRRALERMLGAFKRNEREYALVPSELNADGKPTGFKFRLMASPGTRAFDITKIKDAHKVDILVSCLSQFLMLGLQGAGGNAQAHSISSMGLLGKALVSFLDMIVDTVNQQLVAPMMKFNRFKRENWPTVAHGDVDAPTLEELGSFLKTMFDIGSLTVDDEVREHLYEQAKLPFKSRVEGEKGADGVVPMDQLIAQVMGGTTPALPAQSGSTAVRTSDELIADVLPGGIPASAGAPAGAAPVVDGLATGEAKSVQDTAMNGTQVASMLEVITSVADGLLPRESGLAILQIAFRLTPEQAESAFGTVGAGFVPTKPAVPAPFGGGGFGKPKADAPHEAPAAPVTSADDLIAGTKPQ